MQTLKNLEKHFRRIEGIRYDNEHGGAYAYVQFLAYSRELLNVLRILKRFEKEGERIESIAWLFNEYLAARFTARQASIFEEKMMEVKDLFALMRLAVRQEAEYSVLHEPALHQAAA